MTSTTSKSKRSMKIVQSFYSDTNSLAYEIATENCYKDISGDVEDKFEASNYTENHVSGSQLAATRRSWE